MGPLELGLGVDVASLKGRHLCWEPSYAKPLPKPACLLVCPAVCRPATSLTACPQRSLFNLPAPAAACPCPASPALPCRGDLVQIETWFQEDGKLAAQRDFVLTELGSGRVLGRATSTWVTINIAVGAG